MTMAAAKRTLIESKSIKSMNLQIESNVMSAVKLLDDLQIWSLSVDRRESKRECIQSIQWVPQCVASGFRMLIVINFSAQTVSGLSSWCHVLP